MIHLTPADYIRQPWANGRGTTTELYRIEQAGQLLLRLSMATVSEDGPFSLFPGIERNLTVLTGPGFTLTGETLTFEARPLTPVAFPGDIPIAATNVTAPSTDFNVMTARALPLPAVRVIDGTETLPSGQLTAVFALSRSQLGTLHLQRHDLALVTGAATVTGHVLGITCHGLTLPT